jgi:hypothetical protein
MFNAKNYKIMYSVKILVSCSAVFFLSFIALIHVKAQTLTVSSSVILSSNASYTSITVNSGGTLTINSGVTITVNSTSGFASSGGNTFVNGNLIVAPVASTGNVFNLSGNGNFTINDGGLVTVNGNVFLSGGSFLTVNGTMDVLGSFEGSGNIVVAGNGSLGSTGPMTSNGSSIIFNSTMDCNTGPCNATNICKLTSSISSSQSICIGATAATLTCLNSPSGSSYQWKSSPDNYTFTDIAGATTSSYSFAAGTPSASTYYKLLISTGSGNLVCVQQTNSTLVTVNPLPAPSITAGGPTAICAGGSVSLSSSSASSYLWSNGATTQSITVNSAGTYSVIATNNGCSGASAATTVTVNPLPAPVITAGGPTAICAGGSVTLSSSSASSYLWSNGATTQSITVNSAGSYSVALTNSNGCKATSSPTTVTVGSCTFGWTGMQSTDWNTAGNWDSGIVPVSADNAVISALCTNMPVLTGPAYCTNLTILAGASFTNNAGTLYLSGNLTNNGNYTDNAGTTVFSGTAGAQSVSGKMTFRNLTLNNASGLSLNDTCTVAGILTLSNGQLSTNGKLKIDLNNGSIAYNASDNGSIWGNLKVSKNISCYKTHYLSSPLNGTTANEFYDDAMVIEPSTSKTRLFSWTSSSQAWTAIYGTSTSLVPMAGYSLYFLNPTVLDFTGTYSHSAGAYLTSFTATAANQSMLIGNPYPSALDWESGGWSRSNVKGAVNYWNACAGKYASYAAGTSTNGGTQYIPAMQSFFVQTIAAGTASVSVNNPARTSSNPSLWRQGAASNTLKLTLSSGAYDDETVIRFNENAVDGFDNDLDASKFKNPDLMPSFYSVSDNEEYSINTLPLTEEKIIPLNIEAGFSGTYTITAQEAAAFNAPYILILRDKLLNTETKILDSSYTFQVNQGQGTDRFSLVYRAASSATQSSGSQIVIGGFEKTVRVNCPNTNGEAKFYLYNSTGQLISETSFDAAHTYSHTSQNIISGIYLVKVVTAQGPYAAKVYLTE